MNRKFIYATVLFITILASLVIFRSVNKHHFKNDLSKWAIPSLNKNNLVTEASLINLEKPLLLVLDNASIPQGETLKVDFKNIINKETLSKIEAHEGAVVIVSNNPATAAKAWMLLSQMGITHIYLLDQRNNEQFKFEFKKDSLVNTEL